MRAYSHPILTLSVERRVQHVLRPSRRIFLSRNSYVGICLHSTSINGAATSDAIRLDTRNYLVYSAISCSRTVEVSCFMFA